MTRQNKLRTEVLIIGAGATGTGLARDLGLRGIQTVLADQGDINSGASGANHGLLHSGARYVASNPHSAKECQTEAALLKDLAPQCIDPCNGLFVAIQGDDEQYIADFPGRCAQCAIPVQELSIKEARDIEPALSPRIIAAYQVPDGAIDPFQLSLANLAQAQEYGTRFLPKTQARQFTSLQGRITEVTLWQKDRDQEITVEAEIVVNAAGAWAGEIAALGNIDLPMVYSKGTILITQNRISSLVINRLRPPADGDILVPGGTVSLLGTTSVRIASLQDIRPTSAEAEQIISEGSTILPVLSKTRYIRAYAGVRPLLASKGDKGNDRSLERDIVLLDHALDGIHNFITITGGKLTTFRLMAEKAADLVCQKLGLNVPCVTQKTPLPPGNQSIWTTPGLAPKAWLHGSRSSTDILCECELVPEKIFTKLQTALAGHSDRLQAVSLRTRVGKGPCQGTCCGFRTAGLLARQKEKSPISHLRNFLEERWKGEQAVLWGSQLIQAEMKEAFYCGTCGLENPCWPDSPKGNTDNAS